VPLGEEKKKRGSAGHLFRKSRPLGLLIRTGLAAGGKREFVFSDGGRRFAAGEEKKSALLLGRKNQWYKNIAPHKKGKKLQKNNEPAYDESGKGGSRVREKTSPPVFRKKGVGARSWLPLYRRKKTRGHQCSGGPNKRQKRYRREKKKHLLFQPSMEEGVNVRKNPEKRVAQGKPLKTPLSHEKKRSRNERKSDMVGEKPHFNEMCLDEACVVIRGGKKAEGSFSGKKKTLNQGKKNPSEVMYWARELGTLQKQNAAGLWSGRQRSKEEPGLALGKKELCAERENRRLCFAGKRKAASLS